MPELFVYDASEVNRSGYDYHNYSEEDRPVVKGFRDALRQMDLPRSFLIRGLFGDYEWLKDDQGQYVKPYNLKIKNIFEKRSLFDLLSKVLSNGTDRSESDPKSKHHIEEILTNGLSRKDFIWVLEYTSIDHAIPYRFSDLFMDGPPQGFVNDFTMVFDRSKYIPDTDMIYHQPDIKKRRKALLGIIISDTNPNRPELKPMRFSLTPENLVEVLRKINGKGYFA